MGNKERVSIAFMNDMAEESEITSFLQNMKENGAQESEDGMYRWMIED